jgi:hypothetical protein
MYVYWFGVYGWILLCLEELEFGLSDVHRGTTSCLYILKDPWLSSLSTNDPTPFPVRKEGNVRRSTNGSGVLALQPPPRGFSNAIVRL